MSGETPTMTAGGVNSPRQVLFASLIGTTIEFFDFYIYATAAVLVFPRLFFPASDPASATLASLATFKMRLSDAFGPDIAGRRAKRGEVGQVIGIRHESAE